MKSTFPCCALAAASLLVALGGCELFKSNEQVLAVINQRVIGMPVGDFFDRYGQSNSREKMPDGSTEYDWTSAVPYAPPGPAGQDDRICKLHITADRQGRITSADVRYDAPGLKSTSRCGEIFAEK